MPEFATFTMEKVMSGFGDDDFSLEEHSAVDRNAALARRARRLKSLTMFDNIRATMYSAMAGMLEAGLEMQEASEILADEYEREKMDDAAASVALFFGTVAPALSAGKGKRHEQSDLIGDTALRAFGEKFVGPEEMALLKSLSIAAEPAKIFAGIAKIIAQYEQERASGTSATFRRVAG